MRDGELRSKIEGIHKEQRSQQKFQLVIQRDSFILTSKI